MAKDDIFIKAMADQVHLYNAASNGNPISNGKDYSNNINIKGKYRNKIDCSLLPEGTDPRTACENADFGWERWNGFWDGLNHEPTDTEEYLLPNGLKAKPRTQIRFFKIKTWDIDESAQIKEIINRHANIDNATIFDNNGHLYEINLEGEDYNLNTWGNNPEKTSLFNNPLFTDSTGDPVYDPIPPWPTTVEGVNPTPYISNSPNHPNNPVGIDEYNITKYLNKFGTESADTIGTPSVSARLARGHVHENILFNRNLKYFIKKNPADDRYSLYYNPIHRTNFRDVVESNSARQALRLVDGNVGVTEAEDIEDILNNYCAGTTTEDVANSVTVAGVPLGRIRWADPTCGCMSSVKLGGDRNPLENYAQSDALTGVDRGVSFSRYAVDALETAVSTAPEWPYSLISSTVRDEVNDTLDGIGDQMVAANIIGVGDVSSSLEGIGAKVKCASASCNFFLPGGNNYDDKTGAIPATQPNDHPEYRGGVDSFMDGLQIRPPDDDIQQYTLDRAMDEANFNFRGPPSDSVMGVYCSGLEDTFVNIQTCTSTIQAGGDITATDTALGCLREGGGGGGGVCNPGTVKLPEIPYSCIACGGNTYSATSDATECKECKDGTKPNVNHTECIDEKTDFILYALIAIILLIILTGAYFMFTVR